MVRRERLVARPDDVPYPRHRTLPHVRADMGHEVVDLQHRAPGHLGLERRPALVLVWLDRRRQVGEVRHVRDDLLEPRLLPLLPEQPRLLRVEGLEGPPPRVPREYLEGRAAQLERP